MKVKELIAALEILDPNLEVLCYSEDNAAINKGQLSFVPHSVEKTKGSIIRKDEGFLFSLNGDETFVVIEMTADD